MIEHNTICRNHYYCNLFVVELYIDCTIMNDYEQLAYLLYYIRVISAITAIKSFDCWVFTNAAVIEHLTVECLLMRLLSNIVYLYYQCITQYVQLMKKYNNVILMLFNLNTLKLKTISCRFTFNGMNAALANFSYIVYRV